MYVLYVSLLFFGVFSLSYIMLKILELSKYTAFIFLGKQITK